jgi:hypothetical protein
VQAGWASAPPTDFSKMDGCGSSMNHGGATSPEGSLIGGALASFPDNVQLANPITYVTKDDPPLYLRHGSSDNIVPTCQSELLWTAMKASGNKKDQNYTAVSGGHAPNTSGILQFFQNAIKNNKEGCMDTKSSKFDEMATYCSTGNCCEAVTALSGQSQESLFSLVGGSIASQARTPLSVWVTAKNAYRIRIVDVNGQEVLSEAGNGPTSYSMHSFQSGVYIVHVATATATQSKRLFR